MGKVKEDKEIEDKNWKTICTAAWSRRELAPRSVEIPWVLEVLEHISVWSWHCAMILELAWSFSMTCHDFVVPKYGWSSESENYIPSVYGRVSQICPAEFNSNPYQTHLAEITLKILISLLRWLWLGLELNCARQWPSRAGFKGTLVYGIVSSPARSRLSSWKPSPLICTNLGSSYLQSAVNPTIPSPDLDTYHGYVPWSKAELMLLLDSVD